MEAAVDEDIEYVELLHNEHQEADAEDASVDLKDGEQHANSIEELTALQMEENCANEGEEICEEEQVMLVEATEVMGDMDVDETQHTIIEHEGRQYLIPTEQLNGVGHTLVIEDEECAENEEEMEEVESNYEVLEADVNGFYSQETTSSGRQFAVLRDGRLHLSDEPDTVIQEKLRAFEQTLSGYDEDEVAEDAEEDNVQQEEDANSSQEENEAITGRNLVTGQTISLRGFLEKMRRREETKKEEFVTVRPVNSRVVVGRTSDGKRLIGKIIQIQKKVQPLALAPATPRPKAPTAIIPRDIQAEAPHQQEDEEEEEEEYCGPLPKKRPKAFVNGMTHPTSVVSEQVARTLAGLMSLQSVRSSIARRKLLVRHVQKHSAGGKVVAGSRRVAYYSGAIRPVLEPPHWKFISDPPTPTSIDLPAAPQHPQTVSLLPEANCIKKEVPEETDEEREEEEEGWGEVLTLHLTETHDEHGIKKTKVSIPQLGGCNVNLAAHENKRIACPQCEKRFHTTGAMRRHQAAHNLPERKMLTCHVCLKKLTTLGGLNEHLRVHEHRPAPLHRYDCSVCRKQFNRHSNLLRHAHIHRAPPPSVDPVTTAKGPPFVCTQCECQYNFISSLTRHIVTEHKA